ncbi:sulfatase [Maribellus sp. YY47]|uniref:sulfatase family protein n=1 Tax=Maribellus sp. YY47 TaxID=2929486 RepID=UPI002000ED31|nr:sulfatase [Maribellus sp. YY47]MCK3684816.1 sulfatase [Maribellus sp. YY47]
MKPINLKLLQHNRRNALSLLILSLFFLLASVCSNASEKPNVVFIIADDISWDDFGCYGNHQVKTPHIDQLAREGLRFDNAFLTASSCSPSRCSIISGKYPHSNRAAELHTELPASEIPFPLLLKENGYYTAHAGKWHMGAAAHRAFDIYTDNNGYKNGDGGEANWIPFLKDRPQDKPFFFWLASHDAHRPWGADTFHITHDPANLEVPVYFADTPETRQDMASYYNEIARFDHYIGKVREELERQGALNNTVIIVMADNGRPFPRCKTRVYDSGMKTPFIVFWPDGLKKKGVRTQSLISSIDVASTILELAEIKQPDDYQGVSFVPILKSVKAETRKYVFSEHNWHDYEAYERMVRTKDFLYLWNARPNLTNCGPADSKNSPTQNALNELRDAGKLSAAQADVFLTPRPAEELFDLSLEKDQLLNVASVEKYQVQLTELRNLLHTWMKETGDTTPENLTPDRFDRETGKVLRKEIVRGTMPGSR